MMRRHEEGGIVIDEMAFEADRETLKIPLVGFVTAAAISVGLWGLIVWTMWNLTF